MDAYDFLALVGLVVLVLAAFMISMTVGLVSAGSAVVALAVVLSLAGSRQE